MIVSEVIGKLPNISALAASRPATGVGEKRPEMAPIAMPNPASTTAGGRRSFAASGWIAPTTTSSTATAASTRAVSSIALRLAPSHYHARRKYDEAPPRLLSKPVARPPISLTSKRGVEIVDQILRVLDADREAQKIGRHWGARAFNRGTVFHQ